MKRKTWSACAILFFNSSIDSTAAAAANSWHLLIRPSRSRIAFPENTDLSNRVGFNFGAPTFRVRVFRGVQEQKDAERQEPRDHDVGPPLPRFLAGFVSRLRHHGAAAAGCFDCGAR